MGVGSIHLLIKNDLYERRVMPTAGTSDNPGSSLKTKLTAARALFVESKDERYGYVDSSDSEGELEEARKTNEDAEENRRKYKASQLAAIATTFFPSTEAELKVVQEIQEAKKRAQEATDGDKERCDAKIEELVRSWTKERFSTSMYQNPYLRRAFRKAVTSEVAVTGTSAEYAKYQAQIREKLYDILREDHKKMKWKREDFSSDPEWEAVRYSLEHSISNNKRKGVRSTGSAITGGKDTKGTSPQVAFHHLVWKEAFEGEFSDHALNMANLVLANDQRTSSKHPNRAPGAHENAHIIGQDTSQSGGPWKAMDPQVVAQMLDVVAQKRSPKREIYGGEVDTTLTEVQAGYLAEARAK